ncbi:MAG: hypothetical protein EA397_01385 [Deltaproteobacteria bacterium]|nr:MAG: hypothetical protein EA397_01385 [Deltaproteobacteria bacterium]
MTRSSLSLLPLALVVIACNNDVDGIGTDSGEGGPAAPQIVLSPEDPRTTDNLSVEIVDPIAGLRYEYSWSRDDELQEDLTSDLVNRSNTRKGEVWQVSITPFEGNLSGTPATAQVEILNTPPEITAATWAHDPPDRSTGLSVDLTATDDDDDDVTFRYAWTVDGSDAAVTSAEVSGEELSRGQIWSVTITPNDGEEDGESVTLSTTIGNSPPLAGEVVLAPSDAVTDSTLTATATGFSDPDGDEITLTYRFLVDEAVVQQGSDNTLGPAFFVKHDVVTAEVFASDDQSDGPTATSNEVVIRNTAPVAESVRIGPETPGTLDNIEAVPSATDLDDDPLTFTYTWTLNDAVVSDVTGPLFPHGRTERDDRVKVEIFATDDDHADSNVLESIEVTVVNTPPSTPGITVAPPRPDPGDPIACSVTTPSTDPDPTDTITYHFSWTVNGEPYVGSTMDTGTSSSLPGAVVEADQNWRCEVYASDGFDDSGTASGVASTVPFQCADDFTPWSGGSGESGNPYAVDTRDALDAIRTAPHCTFRLTNDIDISGLDWDPIPEFSGVLNGDGYAIESLRIDRPDLEQLAFIHTLTGRVQDISFTDAYVSCERGCAVVARTVQPSDSTDEIGMILNTHVHGEVLGARNIVGIAVQLASGSVVSNTHFTGRVVYAPRASWTPAFAGGLFNTLEGVASQVTFDGVIDISSSTHMKTGGIAAVMRNGGVLDRSSSHGSVEGVGTRIGGLVGEIPSTSTSPPLILDSYTDMSLEGTTWIAGLIGDRQSSFVISTSYSAAEILSGSNTRGVLGFGSAGGTRSDVYWDMDRAGTTNAGTTGAGVHGRTTDQMLDASTYDGFDQPPWEIVDGDYPWLPLDD